jgi:hypothetical protein
MDVSLAGSPLAVVSLQNVDGAWIGGAHVREGPRCDEGQSAWDIGAHGQKVAPNNQLGYHVPQAK